MYNPFDTGFRPKMTISGKNHNEFESGYYELSRDVECKLWNGKSVIVPKGAVVEFSESAKITDDGFIDCYRLSNWEIGVDVEFSVMNFDALVKTDEIKQAEKELTDARTNITLKYKKRENRLSNITFGIFSVISAFIAGYFGVIKQIDTTVFIIMLCMIAYGIYSIRCGLIRKQAIKEIREMLHASKEIAPKIRALSKFKGKVSEDMFSNLNIEEFF